LVLALRARWLARNADRAPARASRSATNLTPAGLHLRVADRVAILLSGRLFGVHGLRAAGLGRRVRLRVRGMEPDVQACLLRVPGARRVSVEREPGADLATYFVDTESGTIAEALARAVVAGGFGLHDMGPAPVDLEALFLGLTSGRPERLA
jgi:hypothetical protein